MDQAASVSFFKLLCVVDVLHILQCKYIMYCLNDSFYSVISWVREGLHFANLSQCHLEFEYFKSLSQLQPYILSLLVVAL